MKKNIKNIIIFLAILLFASAISHLKFDLFGNTYNPLTGLNVPGGFPVHVKIQADVSGQKEQVERTLRCHRTVNLAFDCFGCLRWTQSLTRFGHENSDGSGLIGILPIFCHKLAETYESSLEVREYATLGWVDSLSSPQIIELYDFSDLIITGYDTANPTIELKSMVYNAQPTPKRDVRLSDSRGTYQFAWFPTGDHGIRGNSSPHRLFAGLRIWVLPEVTWKCVGELAALARQSTDTPRVLRKRNLSEKTLEMIGGISRGVSPCGEAFVVSARPITEDTWAIDQNLGKLTSARYARSMDDFYANRRTIDQPLLARQYISVDGVRLPITTSMVVYSNLRKEFLIIGDFHTSHFRT